jgi:hypothetical protein
MATTKLTLQRGGTEEKEVTVSAGSAEAQSDTISVNIDYTNLRKGEAVLMLETIKMRIQGSPTWPPQ